ncbi:MAG: DUF2332 domain-containing protein [Burkholderiales bacterium]|nr:DUF2332 domain-containing protein [Burkholderiales bacterium]
MTAHADPAISARLQARFADFVQHAALDDPLYAAIAAAVAAHPDWAALLAAAPVNQQLPMLWFAALQDRLLERVAAGERPPLARYYASAGGTSAPDDALAAHLGAFIDAHRAELRVGIASGSTQTNEIGRCAVLWPVLQSLVEATGNARIALLDVGCSAGLNLGVDRWGYRYVDDASGATIAATPARDAAAPEIACRVLAGARADFVRSGAVPDIVARAGIDLKPVAVDDARAVRWLRACLWPHDTERRQRFDAAVAVARTQHWPLRAVADAAAAIVDWLEDLPPDVTPVVFNSWVLTYFDAPLLRRHVQTLLDLVARRGVAWISAESPRLSRGFWPGKPASAADDRPNATSWTLACPDGHGGIAWRLAATSHAHGRWMLCEG